MMRRHQSGFTLIEVIGAFFMMIVVLVLVTGIFVENGRQRDAASELMRVHTTAAGALDLLAQDIEAAIYFSPAEGEDIREHPWVFLASRSGESGATFLHFQTQNVPHDRLGEHGSTWVDVVYFLTEEEDQRYTLWRWRSTRPPADANRPDPDPDDPGSARVVDGLSDFGVVFVDSQGTSVDEWDSSFAAAEEPLPIAAEIRMALYRSARPGEAETDELEVPGRLHVRPVSIPMHRPIDVAQLVSLGQTGAKESGCATIDDCRKSSDDEDWYFDARDACEGVESDLCNMLNSSGSACWNDLKQLAPNIADSAPPECDAL